MTLVGAAGLHVPVSVTAQGSAPTTSTYVPLRTPDGQPLIQGIWQSTGGSYSLEDLELQVIYQQNQRDESRRGKSRIIDPPNGKIPYQPWAAALAKKYFDVHTDPPGPQFLDPVARCIVHGVPRAMFQEEYEIFQSPGHVAFLHAPVHQYRIVPLDGRPPLGKDIQLYMGDSRGRWEGNTLVIESSNFTNKTWLDIVGSFHTDAVRFIERLTPISPDRIDYQVTVEDPKAYTRPWTIGAILSRITEKGYEVWEQACHEGERDAKMILYK
jgi:hypothetical protein